MNIFSTSAMKDSARLTRFLSSLASFLHNCHTASPSLTTTNLACGQIVHCLFGGEEAA